MNHLLLPAALVCAVQLAGYEAVRIRGRGCWNVGATCASCEELRICTSLYEPPIIEQCPRETPYCKSGSCVTVPDPALCASKFRGFRCPPEDGTYPDGENCKKYHICIGGEATSYDCNRDGTAYSHKIRACSKGHKCFGAHCSGSKTYVRYIGDYSLYFLCVGGKATLIHRCPEGTDFNEDKQICNRCQREGRMFDVEGDGTTFIECTKAKVDGWTIELQRRHCPAGSTFDPKMLECTIDERTYNLPIETPNR